MRNSGQSALFLGCRQPEYSFSWLGLPATRRNLTLFQAAQAIPAFAKRPFQVGRAVPAATLNPYYEVIVRLPTDDEPTEVPVGLVSKNYELVQHLEILQRTASILALHKLAGCGKSKPGAWQSKHFAVELFYARRRHSTIGDVQLFVT